MFINKIRIPFMDTDASGRIHFSALFRYFEQLDHDFFRKIGYPYKNLLDLGFQIPRVHVECNYVGAIEYDDELEGHVSVLKVGRSSYTLSFQFYKNHILMAQGSMTNVFIDPATQKSVPIPDFIREELKKHVENSVNNH